MGRPFRRRSVFHRPLQPREVRPQAVRGDLCHALHHGGGQAGAVHLACTLHQVVRLVHQHAQAPLQRLRQAPQQRRAIEGVVDIAHQHIAPPRHFLAQVVGAQAMVAGDAPLRCGVQPALVCGLRPRSRQAVVEAPGERAGLPVAGLVRVLAGRFLGHDGLHAQGRGPVPGLPRQVLSQVLQRLKRRALGGAFAGQVGDPVQPLLPHGAQGGEQRADGLADARGGLCQQVAATGQRPVGGLGQAALALTEGARRKSQGAQRRVTRLAVGGLLLGPMLEGGAALQQALFQFGRAEHLEHLALGLADDVEVHQGQRQFLHTALAAEQGAVGQQLRPVQVAAVLGDVLGLAADGLHLLQAAASRVVAVGPAAHAQRATHGFQRHLRLVVQRASAGHDGLALQAFQGGGGGGETAVQIAALGRELAQAAHRDGVGPGRPARRRRRRGPVCGQRLSHAGRCVPAPAPPRLPGRGAPAGRPPARHAGRRAWARASRRTAAPAAAPARLPPSGAGPQRALPGPATPPARPPGSGRTSWYRSPARRGPRWRLLVQGQGLRGCSQEHRPCGNLRTVRFLRWNTSCAGTPGGG